MSKFKLILWILLLVLPIVAMARINIKEAQAAWSPTMGSWMRRQMLNIVNSSTVTLHTNTTVAVTVDTKALVGQGRLKSDCSDIRVLYQPDSSTNTELSRHLVYPGGGNCGTSTATKVYFSLQADITTTDTTNDYYLYFDNPQASTPANTDNAFDIGNKDALLVCPFEGSTTCAAGETPSTATGAIRYSAGKSALSFDGKSDYIDVGTTSSLALTAGGITLEAWVKPSLLQDNSYIISKAGAIANEKYYMLKFSADGSVTGNIFADGTAGEATATTPASSIVVNSWQHVTYTYDGTYGRIFINGTLLATSGSYTRSAVATGTNNNTIIGYRSAVPGFFAGQIDEVRISNVARYTSNFTPQTTPFVRDAYTKLLYHMDENGDDPRNTGKAIDDSGNGNHGTITGAKYVDGLVGVDNSSTTTGNIHSQSYASRDGIFVEEGTTNKITNPSFENDTYNTNWTATTGTASLYDEFLDTKAAGAVNGTTATDGVNTRTVTDTLNRYSIGSGTFNSSSGASSDWTDPRLVYDGTNRSAGKVFLGEITIAGGYGYIYGLRSATTGGSVNIKDSAYFAESQLNFYNGTNTINVGSWSTATQYKIALVLRSSGSYFYIKGGSFTNWTLLYIDSVNNTATLYPSLQKGSASTTFTSGFIRIPTSTYLPTPLAYDTFTRGDGAIGNSETTGPDSQETPSLAWTGGAISSNKLSISPTVGATVLTNGDFSNWTGDNPDNWTLTMTEDASNYITEVGPTGQARFVSNGGPTGINQGEKLSSDYIWYEVSGDVTNYISGSLNVYVGTNLTSGLFNSAGTKKYYFRKTTNNYFQINRTATEDITIDNLAAKPLTLSSLFSTVSTSDKDIVISADTTLTSDTGVNSQAGIATNINSASTPTAGLVAYHNGTNVVLDKFTTATTWTNLINTAATYSAGATLRVVTYHSDASTLKVRVYYNNTLVGSEQTVTDASIRDNTIHGLFSTYSGNTFDNFTLFARGSDGEYSIPGEFDGTVTVTEETSAPYVKFGSSSLKAVATYDGTVTTAINPGNTNTHTLSAYVYDGTSGNIGGTVSSSIASLVFNSVPVTTTYTDMGGGWWRLTYSAAGVNASGNYGVEVMSGKTVYIDGVQLEEKAYATTYADGSLDTTGKYDWTGTANDSTSTRTVTNLQYATSSNINASAGTISLWVKPEFNWEEGSASQETYLFRHINDADNRIYLYQRWASNGSRNGTKLVLGNYTATGTNLDTGKWYNIVFAWNNGSAEWWINNVSQGTFSYTNLSTLHSTFEISDGDKNRTISDYRIYNTSLSTTEVSDLYYSGLISKSDTYATVTVDNFQDSTVLGATTTNKITNPSFENSTYNTNWTQTQEYTLQDEFTDTRAAGSVNGTTATDGINTRTVTDTNNVLSISSGQLSCAAGGVGGGNPGLWYPSTARSVGKVELIKINPVGINAKFFGYDTSPGANPDSEAFLLSSGGINTNGWVGLGSYSASTDYQVAVILRGSGAYYFIKGGVYTNWTLLHTTSVTTTNPLYPSITGYNSDSSFTSDYIRIPTTTFLPTPLAYDTFTTAGATTTETTGPDSQNTPQLTWTGGTKSGGKMSVTPTLGNELITNGDFSNWTADNPDGWTLAAAEDASNYITQTGPTGKARIVSGAVVSTGLRQNIITDKTWYKVSGTADTIVTGIVQYYLADTRITGAFPSTGTTIKTARASGSSGYFGLYRDSALDITIDDISVKPLTLSSLFSTVPTSDANVIADVTISALTSGTQGGLVLNLDSTSSPDDFILVYHDGTKLYVDEVINGVYTNKQNTTVALGAGALRVVRDGTKLRAYLNNALVGAELTMTANTNTRHGLFSTYSGNTFDNFTLFARGSDGEYSNIPDDPATHLTAEENSTATYNKSGGKSVKLTNTNASYPFEYVTAINPGNTNTHTLSAYVYNATSGSVGGKIDSSVAKLVFNGSVVTPSSYTQVDGNWWRLTYSAAAANSSADYGIEVQGGKTLYMDSVQLEEGASATNYVDGSLGRGFEWTGTVNNSTSQRIGGEGKGESPISIWHMDEGYGTTANDSSINLNALTISGATWSNTTGNGGKYLTFDGTDDKLSRSFDMDFDFGADPFTISGFFRHTSAISGTDTILSRQSGSVGYKVYMNSSGYICFAVNTDTVCTDSTTGSFADSKWHSFSAVRGTENIKIYVDGDEKALTNQSSPATVNGANSLYIGIDTDGVSNPWTGDLDEISIYPYARTATQVRTDNLGIQVSTVLASNTYDPLTQGLVGWWNMDETATPSIDSSGNGNSGTWVNNTYGTGKFGNAASFDGSGDVITVGDLAILEPTNVTLSFWAKTNDYTTRLNGGVGKGNILGNGLEYSYAISFDGTTVSSGVTNESNTSYTASGTLGDNNWHLWTMTFNGSTLYFYKDGVLANSKAVSGAIDYTKTSNSFAIGARPDSSFPINGYIDDVRVYNRALDNNEVMSLYKYAPGPVAHWKMDEGSGTTAYDSSGNSNTGTVSGANYVPGKYSKALSFDGGDYVDAGNNSSMYLPGNFTMEAWIKPNSLTYQAILGKDNASNRDFLFGHSNTSGKLIFYNPAASEALESSSAVVTTGQWQHVVVTRSGTSYSFYYNGVSVGSVTGTATSFIKTNNIQLGRREYTGSNQYFNGSLDDVRIYNYARTQEQIISDLNASHPAPGSPVGSAIAHYKFDEGYGATVNNSGSGGGSGTITGATWSNSGKYGKSLSFVNTSDSVNLGDVSYLDGVSGMTYSMWVKPSAVTTKDVIISKYASTQDSNSITMRTQNTLADEIYVFISDSLTDNGGTYFATSNLNLAANEWQHLLVVFNGAEAASTRVKVYKNGKLISGTVTGTLPTTMTSGSTSNLKIGLGDFTTEISALAGLYDEVKLYNFAFTPDQIKTEYNKGAALVLGSNTDSGKVIASDSFNKSSMGTTEVGNYTWTGSTWSTANGKAVNTPATGSELLTNLGMEGTYDDESGGGGATINVAPNWDGFYLEKTGGETLDKETTIIHGDSASQKVVVDATMEGISFSSPFTVENAWYQASAWFYRTGTYHPRIATATSFLDNSSSSTPLGEWTQLIATGRKSGVSAESLRLVSINGGTTFYIDDTSAKQLTLSSLFSTVPTSSSDIVASTEITFTSGTIAGLVTNLDSASSPANFLIAYLSNAPGLTSKRVVLDKFVNGTTYTNLISSTITYSAGAKLQVVTYHSDANTLKVKVYYNGAQVGTEQTVTDTAIINNTIHGLFSTYSGNTFDNFKLETNTQNTVQDYCVPGSTDYCGSPVAAWNMDEGTGQYAQDTSGNANTGTLGTGVTADASDPTWTQGKIGKGLSFDGSNDYINCGSSSLITSLTAITVQGWVKISDTSDGRPVFASYSGGVSYPGFFAHYVSSRPLLYLGGSNYRYFNNSPVNLYDGRWHFITFVVTGNGQDDIDNSKLYVDGREQTVQSTVKTGPPSSFSNCTIGKQSVYRYKGGMDNLSIYNYARTPSQIAWDYNRGKALIHLKFDEESGTTAYDSSGTVNGTISGATVSTSGKLNNALSFDGSDDFVSVTSTSSVNAVSFWMKQSNTSDKSIIDLGGGYTVTLASNAISTAGFSSPTVYVDGKVSSSITDTNWHYITVTTSTSFALSNPTIGKVSTNFFTGLLDDIKLFNYPLTATQVKDLYNSGAIKFDR